VNYEEETPGGVLHVVHDLQRQLTAVSATMNKLADELDLSHKSLQGMEIFIIDTTVNSNQ